MNNTRTLDLSTGIPRIVTKRMREWGAPAAPRHLVTTDEMWLPTATGQTLHLATSFDVHSGTAASLCKSGSAPVQLVSRELTAPGDVLERWCFTTSARHVSAWQKVAVSLHALNVAGMRSFGDTEDAAGYRGLLHVVEIIELVARGAIARDQLAALGKDLEKTPVPIRAFAPWLVVAASSGIDRHCGRCERLAHELPGRRDGRTICFAAT